MEVVVNKIERSNFAANITVYTYIHTHTHTHTHTRTRTHTRIEYMHCETEKSKRRLPIEYTFICDVCVCACACACVCVCMRVCVCARVWVCVLSEEMFSGYSWCHCWTNGCSVLCASKELWIKLYAHSVRIDKIWSHLIGWVCYINVYQSIWSFNIPLSQQPPQAFEVLKISLFLGPECCSTSLLKVLDLIVNFCKKQLIVSAIVLFRCTSDLKLAFLIVWYKNTGDWGSWEWQVNLLTK